MYHLTHVSPTCTRGGGGGHCKGAWCRKLAAGSVAAAKPPHVYPCAGPRGFAFVSFTCRADAERAILLCNEKVIRRMWQAGSLEGLTRWECSTGPCCASSITELTLGTALCSQSAGAW